MKFTSSLVIAALFAATENTNAIQINQNFIDSSELLIKEEPAAVPTSELKQKKLDDEKATNEALQKSKNETANNKLVGEKMKAAKEAADAKLAAK